MLITEHTCAWGRAEEVDVFMVKFSGYNLGGGERGTGRDCGVCYSNVLAMEDERWRRAGSVYRSSGR